MKKIDILPLSLIFLAMNLLSMNGSAMTSIEYINSLFALSPSSISRWGSNIFWSGLVFYFIIYRRRNKII